MLTVRGKAAEGGAEGDVISVLNEQSKRTVQGVVVGPGRVVISTSSPRLAANIAPTNPQPMPTTLAHDPKRAADPEPVFGRNKIVPCANKM